MKVLAIESSCDDTSFAVVNDNKKVDFHETINHRKFHREHGGVVPEMAASVSTWISWIIYQNFKKK